MYNNQFFDYLSEQLPRHHRDMFAWCEVIYANTPILVNGIKKLINYPITDIIYEGESESKKKATKRLLEDHLKIKSHLINSGLDYYIYGNAFRSLYFPFNRFLVCKACGNKISIDHANYTMKRGDFVLECGECRSKRIAEIEDIVSDDLSELCLVSWDPKTIELIMNPITGKTVYYYTLPANIRSGIMRGDPNIVATLPKVFFESFKKNKPIEMTKNFYHFKAPGISGYATGWGISPLVPTMKLYMYTAILRKAVEALGLEHITPQRILFPQASTSDPTMMGSMSKWKEQVQKALAMWRLDPNYVMMAPFPTGVVDLGSRGRSLMPTAEIKQAEEDMLRALDIPLEFVMGSTNIQNSGVSLRILENQLEPYTAMLEDYLAWIIRTINAKYDKDYCDVKFTPFTLADDLMNKQLMLQAQQTGGVSLTTLQEALRLDPEEEREKAKVEQLNRAEDERKLQQMQAEKQQDIAALAREEALAQQSGSIAPYDQQKMIQQAQETAQQLFTIPYEQRKGQLAQLQNEDYVMWALISKQLESMHDQARKEKPDPGAVAAGTAPA
jgi:hypothetical protein